MPDIKEESMNMENTGDSKVILPTFSLTRLIHIEHNYNHVLMEEIPGQLHLKRTLRQLVFGLHDKLNPGKHLPVVELEEQTRRADLIQKRLRRFMAKDRRYIEFSPMSPFQEVIVKELADEMSCSTRFYTGEDGRRYSVVYKPGDGPNSYELRARQGDLNLRRDILRSAQIRKKRAKVSSVGLKTEVENSRIDEFSALRLGHKILKDFNAKSHPVRKNMRSKRKEKENIGEDKKK